MTRPDLDAIRARIGVAHREHPPCASEDVTMLLAYVEELEAEAATLRHRDVLLKRVHGALADMCCRVPMGIDEPVDAIVRASLARANQRFVDEYDARVSAEERALTAEERLERVTHERDQERQAFEQENIALRQELARLMDDH